MKAVVKRIPGWMIFLFFLTFITGIISYLPLLVKPTNVFYDIDSEATFVSNPLQFLYTGKIYFTDYPGTPTTALLSLIYLPWKLSYEIVSGKSFILWVVGHWNIVFWVMRTVSLTIFLLGYFWLHLSIYKLFKSYITNLFLFALFFFDPMLQMNSTKVGIETLAMVLVGFWFWLFTLHKITKQNKYLWGMAFATGLLIANKTTYGLPIVATFIISTISLESKKTSREKLRGVERILLLAILGLVLGTLPVIYDYPRMLLWLLRTFFHTEPDGSGKFGLVDLSQFSMGINYWVSQRTAVPIIILLITVKSLLKKTHLHWKALMWSGVIGFIVFLKFPVIRYQPGNLILIFLSATYFFNQLSTKLKLAVVLVTMVVALFYGYEDYRMKRDLISQSANLQTFVDQISADKDIIWEFGNSNDFSLIRARNFSNKFFNPQLAQTRAHLWELYIPNPTRVVDHYDKLHDINSFCWYGMIIQSKVYQSLFLPRQSNPNNFLAKPIPQTQMLFVQQRQCSIIN